MPSCDAIEVRSLTKKYCGHIVLDNISFNIKSGSIVGLIGPNGAGKSTLLKILTGLIDGTSGEVLINGISVVEDSLKTKKYISFMPENNPLPDHMRVGEYLRFRAELKGVPYNKIHQNAEKVMRQCGLYHDARYRIIKTLSKGYRQRIGIADAMLHAPNIIMLDEPTVGLDPVQIIGVKEILLKNKGARTILISSHILPQLESVCDSFIILNYGRIISSGTLDSLANSAFTNEETILSVRGNEDIIKRTISDKNVHIKSMKSSGPSGIYDISFVCDEKSTKMVLKRCLDEKSLTVLSVNKPKSTLEDIFMKVINSNEGHTTELS